MSKNWMDRLQDSDESKRILEQERLLLEITETIAILMEENKITRSELANRIGSSPAYITKMLRGDNNFTLRKLSDVFYALGQSAHMLLGEIGDSVQIPTSQALQLIPIGEWSLPKEKSLRENWNHKASAESIYEGLAA